MNFKKTTLTAICIYLTVFATAQTKKDYFLYNKIIKKNNELSIILSKNLQLYYSYIKQDSTDKIKLLSCFIDPEFQKFPICWDIDNINQLTFMTLDKGASGVGILKRTPKSLIEKHEALNYDSHIKSTLIFPFYRIYLDWERKRMRKRFLQYYKDLYYGLSVVDSNKFYFYITKKDSIQEFKRAPGFWFTKSNTLSQNFNGIFQAIRQNNASYLLTDSMVYKVKEDTLLPTGRIIKKSKDKETTVSNFFIDDKDSETIYLFPPYYFIKENNEAPNIKTLKPKKKLYKSAMKTAEFYIKETE